jgi:Na+/alanine symporter
MTSATDLPLQPDSLQQQPLMKTNNNPIWKVVFITLLLANFGFGYLWQSSERGLGSIGIFILFLMVLVPIDLIVVLSYIITQHPKGIAKVLTYIVLSLILMYIVFRIVPILPSLMLFLTRSWS